MYGYLAMTCKLEVLSRNAELMDCSLEDLLEDSQFLLEMEFESLVLATHQKQAYWVHGMKSALQRDAGK